MSTHKMTCSQEECSDWTGHGCACAVLDIEPPRRQSWHCVTDGVTYPGCGRCGPCILAAPRMYDELRRWEATND